MAEEPNNEAGNNDAAKNDENAGLINNKSEKKNRYEDDNDSDNEPKHYTSLCCEGC